MFRILAVSLISATTLLAQSAKEFEAVSVKVSTDGHVPPRSIHGGPGSSHPGSAIFDNIDLFGLITMAYGIQAYQLSGPEWLRTRLYNVTVKIPAGATPAEYREMLRTLLVERFHLAVRWEKKPGDVFELAVAKSGPKLKPSAADAPVLADGLQPAARMSPPAGYNGPVSLRGDRYSMERLAGVLAGWLGRPVVDATGLTGEYDIRLQWTGLQIAGDDPATPGRSTVFDALPEQLGLKLVARKSTLDVLLIEHADKVPVEN